MHVSERYNSVRALSSNNTLCELKNYAHFRSLVQKRVPYAQISLRGYVVDEDSEKPGKRDHCDVHTECLEMCGQLR